MDKLKMHSMNKVDANVAQIAALLPNCVTERINEDGKLEKVVDFDMLKQELSSFVVEGNEERYQFTWPDKKKAILAANAPINRTLRPCREESVDFDTTENLYIEGDNLEVLKLLQETYLGKIKMIYIDPPYNTGHDFVYNDDFSESVEEYLANSGQFDENGNRLVQNPESNGRYHTDWLNMIYTRIKIARDLLKDDGVIFISIDDNEIENLRKICDEIFGEINFIANMIWQQGKKSSGNLIGINHEYMLVYAKNRVLIDTPETPFKQKKEGLDKIYSKYNQLKKQHGSNFKEIELGMKEFYASLSESDPAYSHRLYCLVDERGLFQSDNSAAPDKPESRSHRPLIHPITKKPTAVPAMGWRFTDKTLDELVAKGYVHFGEDETKVPRIKRYLKEYEYEMPATVFYKPGAAASSELQKLFGKKIFDNPKDRNEIKRIINFLTSENDIILDFFSGSATTAHAVMQLNADDNGHRRFIMVQLPEKTDEKSEAFKSGYENICEIGKERIRRAGAKLKEESPLTTQDLDIGFRVLKCDSSNMKDIYYNPAELEISLLTDLTDNIKEDRTAEDLLFQVMLDLGIMLSAKVEETTIDGKTVFNVNGNHLVACFDKDLTDETIKVIAKQEPYYFVMRDDGFANDSVATNFEQIFATYSPDTVRKVL